jgi:hypothetical protein
MVSQLRMFEDAIYRSYHALYNFKYRGLEGANEDLKRLAKALCPCILPLLWNVKFPKMWGWLC